MHTRVLATLAAFAIGSGAATAHGATLYTATWTQQIHGIDITVTNSGATCTDTLATHIEQSITCPTAGLEATGSATSGSYSVSLTLPLLAIDQFTTGGVIALYTNVTQKVLSVNITGGPSGVAASMGISGMISVKNVIHFVASTWMPGPTTLLKAPLSIGKSGVATGYFYALTSIHYITADFYAWTPHTRVFTGLTSKGRPLATPTVVAMADVSLTALGGGTVVLVAPSKISIDGPLMQRRTVSLTTLKLTFVPEPGTALLFAGIGLALLRVRRGS